MSIALKHILEKINLLKKYVEKHILSINRPFSMKPQIALSCIPFQIVLTQRPLLVNYVGMALNTFDMNICVRICVVL